MKTGAKVSLIIFIICAAIFCIVASFIAFKNYLETGKVYLLIFASFDMFCAMINIMNLGINLVRWSR